jgi:phosphate transport system protein
VNDGGQAAGPLRLRYAEELEQLRLQVELMGVRVEENLERMRDVLTSGDQRLADLVLAADDEIDAMNVSLTERCYLLLAREGPVAADLRLIVSVVKVLNEFERVGDLALRVVKASVREPDLRSREPVFELLLVMAEEASERFGLALRCWASPDLDATTELVQGTPTMELAADRLVTCLLGPEGDDAVLYAIQASSVGRSLDRIADHAAIVGARVRYLITGEPRFLAAEVR